MPRPNVEKERREQILEAAMTCFSRKGYHPTSMDDITAELPFSKALIYYYFKTKRAIFLAILEEWMQKTTSDWEEMQAPGEPPTAQLHKALAFGTQLIALNRDLVKIDFEFYSEIGRDEQVSQVIQSIFAQFRIHIKNILDAGVLSGEFRPVDTHAMSAVLFGAYEGLALQAYVEPDQFDWNAITENLLSLALQGLAPTKDLQ